MEVQKFKRFWIKPAILNLSPKIEYHKQSIRKNGCHQQSIRKNGMGNKGNTVQQMKPYIVNRY